MFSIAMPAYNAAPTLSEAVESVLEQRLESWQLVIVDDGSKDGTLSIAKAYAADDPRIRIIHQANAGCGPARRVAIDNSIGPYIVHFDADDVLLPSCLDAYAEFISDHPTYDIFSCDAEVFGQPEPVFRFYGEERFPGEERFKGSTEFRLEEMLDGNLIMSAAAVLTRIIYERAGGIRLGAHTEDYDLWLRAMAVGGRHMLLPKVLVRYRMGPGQMSASSARMHDGTAESLEHLAASGILDLQMTKVARKSARRYARLAQHVAAVAARETLEARICRGDLGGARREFLRVRSAYISRTKFALVTPLVMASPRCYAAYVRRVRAHRGGSAAGDGP
jgi:GT2 family glycosyltransferase